MKGACMARETVVYKVCDYPHKRDVVATHTDRVVLNGFKYDIDLCQKHHDELEATVGRWTELGTLKGQPTVFDTAPAPRSITLPQAPRKQVDPVAEELRRAAAMGREPLPPTAERWLVNDHAAQRMRERGVDLYEVLMAAERPEQDIPAPPRGPDRPHVRERLRGDVKLFVDVDRAEVLTVARPSQSTRNPELQKASA